MLTASDQPLRIGVGRCLNDRLGYFGFAERIWSEHEPWLGSAMRVVVEQDRPSCPPRRTATNATKETVAFVAFVAKEDIGDTGAEFSREPR